jgi:hypothetical protein
MAYRQASTFAGIMQPFIVTSTFEAKNNKTTKSCRISVRNSYAREILLSYFIKGGLTLWLLLVTFLF